MENIDKQKLEEALKKKNNRTGKIILAAKLMKESQIKKKCANRCWNKLFGKSKKMKNEAGEFEYESKLLWNEAEIFRNEAEILEEEALKCDAELVKWYKENFLTQKRNESAYTKIKHIIGGTNGLESFKSEIKNKLNWCFVCMLVLSIVQVIIVLLSLCLLSSNNSDKIFGYLYIPNLKRGICMITFLFLIFVMSVSGLYLAIKRYRHYNKAVHKLDTLIIRLELFADKDLIAPNRLDREVEMIFRILDT